MVEPAIINEGSACVPTDFRHTCVTCRVMFASPELHRDHFKSDWHRYNLKRKVVNLTSISAEAFKTKAMEMKEQTIESEESVQSRRCAGCNKSYQTDAAFHNHCKSKKHMELMEHSLVLPNLPEICQDSETLSTDMSRCTSETNEEYEDVESTSNLCGEALDKSVCLFCCKAAQSMDENLKHMSLCHGFFVIDAEYCIDLEGLITYLGQKVGEGFMCLWCNERGRRFRSLDAVQKHMIDKCHCRMYHEGEAMLEYSEFYDYSSSYPDAENVEKSDLDVEINVPALEEQGYELVLPSGAVIGHRSLFRYYKQNLPSSAQVSLAKKQATGRLINEYRSIGWTGTTGEVARRKARDLNFMRKIHAKRNMQIGVKANKLQKHFRSQIDF